MARREQPQGTLNYNIGCCGLREYYGINRSNWCVTGFIDCLRKEWRDHNRSMTFGVLMLVHRQMRHLGNGSDFRHGKSLRLRSLQKYISTHKIGTLRIVPPNKNPNSGNILHGAVYVPDLDALDKHLRATNPHRKKKAVTFEAPIQELG